MGFQEIPLTLTVCFSQDITKRCKGYTKDDSWFQKSLEEFDQFQTSSQKSKKLIFEGFFCPKKLQLISAACVKIHRITLCHF